jgi:hypothetical protein
MLDMLFRVSTFKKSTVKMLVKMPGLKSWIFSGKKFEDSLIFRIRREGGARVGGGGVGACHNFVTLTCKKKR